MLGGSALFAGAGALPENWIKPIVQSVFVPARAQLSNTIVPATGSVAPIVTGQNDSSAASRFAQALGESIPDAHAVTSRYYACVTPNADGTRATINLYRYIQGGVGGCENKPIDIDIYTAPDVPVPSVGNPLSFAHTCGTFCSAIITDAGDLLDRLGIARCAHATVDTVDIESVTNGAKGWAHFNGSSTHIRIDVGPGACSAPERCTPI